jgi:N-methylhydantoinase B
VLDGRERVIGKETLMMKGGDILRLQTAGAGGWGDPAFRAPSAVLRDVVEGKVSLVRARDVYRVAVTAGSDGSPLSVDADETSRIRGS